MADCVADPGSTWSRGECTNAYEMQYSINTTSQHIDTTNQICIKTFLYPFIEQKADAGSKEEEHEWSQLLYALRGLSRLLKATKSIPARTRIVNGLKGKIFDREFPNELKYETDFKQISADVLLASVMDQYSRYKFKGLSKLRELKKLLNVKNREKAAKDMLNKMTGDVEELIMRLARIFCWIMYVIRPFMTLEEMTQNTYPETDSDMTHALDDVFDYEMDIIAIMASFVKRHIRPSEVPKRWSENKPGRKGELRKRLWQVEGQRGYRHICCM